MAQVSNDMRRKVRFKVDMIERKSAAMAAKKQIKKIDCLVL